MTENWLGEAEETLRREILRRGEEITYLANKLEITQRQLKVALETIAILASSIKEIEELLEAQDVGNKSH